LRTECSVLLYIAVTGREASHSLAAVLTASTEAEIKGHEAKAAVAASWAESTK
jgi:hypothetical protein